MNLTNEKKIIDIFETLSVFLLACLLILLSRYFLLLAGIPKILPLIAALIFLGLPVFFIRLRKQGYSEYGLFPKNFSCEIFSALKAGALIFPLFSIGFYFWQKCIIGNFNGWSVPENLFLLSISHLLLAALPEEVFFRGYLQTRLKMFIPADPKALWIRCWPSIVACSALFAGCHFIIDFRISRLAVFFPSLIFGWLKEKTGTVTAPILFHAMCNILMVILETPLAHSVVSFQLF